MAGEPGLGASPSDVVEVEDSEGANEPDDPFVNKLTKVTENLSVLENMHVVTQAWIEKLGYNKWYDKIRGACLDLSVEIIEFANMTNKILFDRDNIDSILKTTSDAREKYAIQFGKLKAHVKISIGELTDGDADEKQMVEADEVDVNTIFNKATKKRNLEKEKEIATEAAADAATAAPARAKETKSKTASKTDTKSNINPRKRPAAAPVQKRPARKDQKAKRSDEDNGSDECPLADSLFRDGGSQENADDASD